MNSVVPCFWYLKMKTVSIIKAGKSTWRNGIKEEKWI